MAAFFVRGMHHDSEMGPVCEIEASRRTRFLAVFGCITGGAECGSVKVCLGVTGAMDPFRCFRAPDSY